MEIEGAREDRFDAAVAAIRRLPPRVFMAAVSLFACLLAVVFVVAQLTFGLLGVLTVGAVVIPTMYLLGRRLESNALRSTPPAIMVERAQAPSDQDAPRGSRVGQ